MYTKTVSPEQTESLKKIIMQLRTAIHNRKRIEILNLYEKANALDLEAVEDRVFNDYNRLVSQGNDIIF